MTIQTVILDGFKSFRDRTEVTLGDLTILAGANSSGKSTIMQALLLMKQTLESVFDPGPLLISGPHVIFSDTAQMVWSAPGAQRDTITLGLVISEYGGSIGYEFAVQREKDEEGITPLPLRLAKRSRISRTTGAAWEGEGITPLRLVKATISKGLRSMTVSPDWNPEQQEQFEEEFNRWKKNRSFSENEKLSLEPEFERDRFFLFVTFRVRNEPKVIDWFYPQSEHFVRNYIANSLRRIIHVPGLRGNPRRTYPVTAVERHFPSPFPDYVASVIAFWQRMGASELKQLKNDLRELGLTWNIEARRISDVEVEIQVARSPTGAGQRARDMVSVADVGFGLSQSLPVAVALLAAKPDDLAYLEQPEIHLHPRAAYQMSRLIHRAVMRGVQVVVETHSELLLLGLQELVAAQEFGAKRAMLHWLQRDEQGVSHLTSRELDKHGGFGDVPVDFGAVSLESMHNYLTAAGE